MAMGQEGGEGGRGIELEEEEALGIDLGGNGTSQGGKSLGEMVGTTLVPWLPGFPLRNRKS